MAAQFEQREKRRWMSRGAQDKDFAPPRRVRDSSTAQSAHDVSLQRIAVLGRTLSSLFFVRELKERLANKAIAVEIALFPAMFDPARSIYTPHAICEFTSSQFWATSGDSHENDRLAALEVAFAERYLHPWLKHGRVTENEKGTDGDGSPPSFSANKGGMFQLLLDFEQELLGKDSGVSVVSHSNLQLTQMWYDEITNKWSLYSEFVKGSRQGEWYTAHQVPDSSTFYDHVIMGFDLDPRGARKASFKQLLESALPFTCPVIRCLAPALCASAMTCVVEFGGEDKMNSSRSDACFYGDKGDSLLEVAERLEPSNHSVGRGLRFNGRSSVWNLTATVKWSKTVRSSFNGGWDKRKVEGELVEAFQALSPGRFAGYKGLVPCFHWQGAWPLSTLDNQQPSCIYDAQCSLGYASDAFVFLNVSGVSAVRQLRACNILHPFKSASDLADLVAQRFEGKLHSRLPQRSEWSFRSERIPSLPRELREESCS